MNASKLATTNEPNTNAIRFLIENDCSPHVILLIPRQVRIRKSPSRVTGMEISANPSTITEDMIPAATAEASRICEVVKRNIAVLFKEDQTLVENNARRSCPSRFGSGRVRWVAVVQGGRMGRRPPRGVGEIPDGAKKSALPPIPAWQTRVFGGDAESSSGSTLDHHALELVMNCNPVFLGGFQAERSPKSTFRGLRTPKSPGFSVLQFMIRFRRRLVLQSRPRGDGNGSPSGITSSRG